MKGSIASGPKPLRSTRGRGLLPHLPSPHVWKGFLQGLYTGYSENLTNVQCSRAAQHRSPPVRVTTRPLRSLLRPQLAGGQGETEPCPSAVGTRCELCQQGCSTTRTTQPVETEALSLQGDRLAGLALPLASRAHTLCPGAGPLAGGWVRWGVFWIEPCPRPPSYLFFSSVHCWPQSSSLDRRR